MEVAPWRIPQSHSTVNPTGDSQVGVRAAASAVRIRQHIDGEDAMIGFGIEPYQKSTVWLPALKQVPDGG